MAESTESTPKKGWRERFLWKLAQRGNVTDAARWARVDRTYPYAVKQRDPAFAAQWEEAEAIAVDHLEKIAFQRAEKQSDTLLIFLLKAHRRQKYGDQVTVTLLLRAMQQLQALPQADMLKALGYPDGPADDPEPGE
jgi:hypothetical protein